YSIRDDRWAQIGDRRAHSSVRECSNVHELFVQSRWEGAHLCDLVTSQLAPYCQDVETRARIEGPDLLLEPYAAHVCWSGVEKGPLFLRWTETGGPRVTSPTRKGFGTRVMERMIRDQLKVKRVFHWRAGGLECEISYPQ